MRLAACPVKDKDEKSGCHSVAQEWLFLVSSPRENYLLKFASHGCAGPEGFPSLCHLFSYIPESRTRKAL